MTDIDLSTMSIEEVAKLPMEKLIDYYNVDDDTSDVGDSLNDSTNEKVLPPQKTEEVNEQITETEQPNEEAVVTDEDKTITDEDTNEDSEDSTESIDTDAVKEDVQNDPIYKEAYDKVFAPFKANGKMLQVKTSDEAINLMQKGANYVKKMEELKPNLKIIQVLKDNDLLDSKKLDYLIDLNRKTPEAIAKLVKEADFNDIDLDDEVVKNYQSPENKVDESMMQIDETLSSLKDSDNYEKLITNLKEWDEGAFDAIAKEPQILVTLEKHIDSGLYDSIKTEMNTQQAFGNLVGLNYLQKYLKVGDMMQERGDFNNTREQASITPQPIQKTLVNSPNKKQAKSTKTNSNSPPTKGVPDYANLSDEEIAKLPVDLF